MARRMLQHTKQGHLGINVHHNGWFAHLDNKATPLSEIPVEYHEEIKRHVREIAESEKYDIMSWGV